jgi:hypothetical protein
VFASPESTAAAVSYTASLITRLTALGDVATAKATMTPELLAIRRALERDRYGMVAQVLTVRDGCTQIQCAAFRSFTDSRQIAINIAERNYDTLVLHYVPRWNAPQPTLPVAALAPGGQLLPTGKPTNAEFPSAASTPPVSIMVPEPGTGSLPNGQHPAQPGASAAKPPAAASPGASAAASAKKPPPVPKRPPPPTAITPVAPAASASAPAPASND